jgi:hypothetical protein
VYFYDGTRRNAVPEFLSQKNASLNGVPETFYPGIDIITPSLFDRTLGYSMLSGTYFFGKIAVPVTLQRLNFVTNDLQLLNYPFLYAPLISYFEIIETNVILPHAY